MRKAIEENDSAKKMKYQMTDSTRNNPDVRTRDITTDTDTREKEAVNLKKKEVTILKLHLQQCLNTSVVCAASHFKLEMI